MQTSSTTNTLSLTLFFKINFLVTCLFFLSFLAFNNDSETLLFTIPAAISTAALLYLIYFILLRPFFHFHKFVLSILITLFTLTNFALMLDFFIYRTWKFHINGMVLNILFSPSAFDSIQMGTAPIFITIGYFLLFVLFELWLVNFLKKKEAERLSLWNRFFNRIIVPFVLIISLSEKVYYGFANMYANDKILESAKPIPLYQPLTFTRFMERHFGLKGVKRDGNTISIKSDSKVNYPLEPIRIDRPNPINIFIFASDAVRNDILKDSVAPNIVKFSKDALWYTNNRSGGDCTRFGIFSLFYGLNSPYWFTFLNAKKGPVFFKTLKKLGYDINVFSSTDTSWPEFTKTVYYDVRDRVRDKFEGKPWEKDAQLFKNWMSWIEKTDRSKPIFSFVFLDGTHGHSYPKEFRKFTPVCDEINYATVCKQDRITLLNSYKNAVNYSDYLIGKMIEKLKKKGLYKNSIIIFTSDHGEEFFEFGNLGHNSSFNIEQTNSPIIVKMPGLKPGKVDHLTSSIDLIPSLMKKVGVANDFKKFSNAKDLFDKDYHRDFVTSGKWYKNAIITPRYTLVFSNLPNEILRTKIYDTTTYRPIPHPQDPNVNKYILEVLDQNSRFIK